MRDIREIKKSNRLSIVKEGEDGFAAWWLWPGTASKKITVIASWGGGWDHVSVAHPNRTPTWDEMCQVKDVFFGDEECVIQFHPPKSEYVNDHPYCLHLWKNQEQNIELPPSIFVGITKKAEQEEKKP